MHWLHASQGLEDVDKRTPMFSVQILCIRTYQLAKKKPKVIVYRSFCISTCSCRNSQCCLEVGRKFYRSTTGKNVKGEPPTCGMTQHGKLWFVIVETKLPTSVPFGMKVEVRNVRKKRNKDKPLTQGSADRNEKNTTNGMDCPELVSSFLYLATVDNSMLRRTVQCC